MDKKYLLVIPIIIVIGLLIGIADIPHEEIKTVSADNMIKESKFSISKPVNWETKAEYPDPILGTPVNEMIASSTLNQPVPSKIKVEIHDLKGSTFDEYLDWGETYVQEVMVKLDGDLQVLDSGETIIDGEQARWSMYTVDIFGQSIKGKSISAAHNGDAYVISIETDEKDFDEYVEQFEEILSTFEFL